MIGRFICWITKRHKLDMYTHTCLNCGITRDELKHKENQGV